MTEQVTIGSFKDGVASDGSPTRVPETTRYSGIGRIKYESLAVSDSNGSGSPAATQTPFLSIPSSSPRAFEGDEVLVGSSSADDTLVGRQYKIAGVAQAGQTSAHRYPLEELS